MATKKKTKTKRRALKPRVTPRTRITDAMIMKALRKDACTNAIWWLAEKPRTFADLYGQDRTWFAWAKRYVSLAGSRSIWQKLGNRAELQNASCICGKKAEIERVFTLAERRKLYDDHPSCTP